MKNELNSKSEIKNGTPVWNIIIGLQVAGPPSREYPNEKKILRLKIVLN